MMLHGDSLLKALRKWRGKTQVDLGIVRRYRSKLYQRPRKRQEGGTPETLAAIAGALAVDLRWISP